MLSRPWADLAPFLQGRVNDDPIGSKRVERRRLIGADRQRTVRLRFTLIGTSSWFWGLDDFQLWGVRSAAESLAISRVTATPEGLRIEWTGADGPYQLQHSPVLPAELWLDHGAPLPASQRSVVVPPGEPASFFRLRLAR